MEKGKTNLILHLNLKICSFKVSIWLIILQVYYKMQKKNEIGIDYYNCVIKM